MPQSLFAHRYRIIRRLGSGSSGTVHEAIDTLNPNRGSLALKIYKPSVPFSTLEKEVALLSRLYHPHVAEVFDWGQDGSCFLITERVDGPDILTHSRKCNFTDKLKLAAALALTLDFIHSKDILHRDLKKENILVSSKSGAIKLVDFGLALEKAEPLEAAGSLPTMAPEQLKNRPCSPATDLYALGIILYEMFVGNHPAASSKPDDFIHFHLEGKAAFPASLPPFLKSLITACLEKKPTQRFRRGLEIAKILNEEGKLRLDLSSYGLLSGSLRKDFSKELKGFLAEVEQALKKPEGKIPPEVLIEQLRRLGRFEEAFERLDHLSQEEEQLKDMALNAQGRLLLERGDYGRVIELKGKTSDLKNTQGLAHFYKGEYDKANRCFKNVLKFHDTPKQEASALNYLGMSAYSQGHLDEALKYYEQAEAKFSRLTDNQPLVSVLMNKAALHQQMGHLSLALKIYEKSLSLARSLKHRYLMAILLNNLANLYGRFGALKEANEFLRESSAIVIDAGFSYLKAYNLLIQADLRSAAGKWVDAENHLREALDKFQSMKMTRESSIARNNLVDNLLQQKKFKETSKLIADEEQKIRMDLLQGKDHKIKPDSSLDVLLAKARFHELKKEPEKELPWIVRAYAHYQDLLKEVPFEYRKNLEKHGAWKGLLERHTALNEEDPVKIVNLKKILEVSRKMASEHHLEALLDFIMDSVIEISGAERGFVVLAPKGNKKDGIQISVARNLDQETIQKAAYKISRTVVAKVLETGKLLITTDAAADPRLKNSKSIQDLKLKSILCAPLRYRSKVLGAIYLENRFQYGVFTQDHGEILSAFCDQAAVSLENARLHEENSRRSHEVIQLNGKLESLLAHKTVELEEVTEKLKEKQNSLEHRYNYDNIVGDSAAMRKIFDVLDRITDRDISVLIMGESGTGKELIARALHFNGPRKAQEFVAINCSAIPAHLLESELFGHVKGSFTGADRDKKGLFEIADRGTLFLDEIGDMPLEMQAKLLRTLQEREIRPLGSNHRIPIDVRVLSATNKNLMEACKAKQFREDLFYRLSAVQIHLPALRERREDIPLLVSHLLEKLSPGRTIRMTPQAVNALINHEWPGNIRELINEIERALTMTDGTITPDFFSEHLNPDGRASENPGTGIRENRAQYERGLLIRTLKETGGNKSLAAKKLGISRVALYQKMKKLEVTL